MCWLGQLEARETPVCPTVCGNCIRLIGQRCKEFRGRISFSGWDMDEASFGKIRDMEKQSSMSLFETFSLVRTYVRTYDVSGLLLRLQKRQCTYVRTT